MLKSQPVSRFQKNIFLFLISIVFLLQSLQAQVATPRTVKTYSKPLPQTQYIPNRSYDIEHIKLDLRFDWQKEAVKGKATITFSPLRTNLTEVEFDAAMMSFASVKTERGKALEFEDLDAKNKLRIKLDKPYQPSNEITVVIEYQTDGKSSVSNNLAFGGGGGLMFIKADKQNPSPQIWSQGESEYNHLWFPCYDHPNDFATTEMIATVEKPYMAISNGRLVEQKDNEDGTRTFHWKMEQPHASYLVSIVVGEFSIIEDRSMSGVPVISYVPKNKVSEARKSVERVPKMVDFFESYTGVKFPFAKYGQVFARKFNGGMENITATTLEEETIIDERSMLDRTSDNLLSHELAHTWFGDLVTCRSWSEIWLNESFATYFQHLWNENNLGRDEMLYRDLRASQNAYFEAWKKDVKRPIVTKNYKDPDAVFDAYAYPRGGAVLHMLRKVLGEDDWKRAINHYLKKHAHSPVETEEFRVAVEEATGQPLEWFFDEWVYKMGHPVFEVTQSYDAVNKKLKVKVKQTQKPDTSFSYPQVTYFQMPVDIEIALSNATQLEQVFIEPVAEQEFTFTVNEKPRFVDFDNEGTLIKELNFEKPVDEWIAQLKEDRDVLGRLSALKELQKNYARLMKTDGEKIQNAIIASSTNDKFWGIRRDAVNALVGIKNESVKKALLAATKDKSPAVRSASIVSLSSLNDPSLASVYLEFLSDKSYEVVDKAAIALGKTKSPTAYDALNKMLEVDSWENKIRISALKGLYELGDARALEAGLKFASSDDEYVQDEALLLIGGLKRDDPKSLDLLAEKLNENAGSNKNINDLIFAALFTNVDKKSVPFFEKIAARITDAEVKKDLEERIEALKKSKRTF